MQVFPYSYIFTKSFFRHLPPPSVLQLFLVYKACSSEETIWNKGDN